MHIYACIRDIYIHGNYVYVNSLTKYIRYFVYVSSLTNYQYGYFVCIVVGLGAWTTKTGRSGKRLTDRPKQDSNRHQSHFGG